MKYDIEELLKQSFQQEQLPDPALQEKILGQMEKKRKKSYGLSWKFPAIAGVVFCSLVVVLVCYFGFQNENGELNVDRMAVSTLQPEHTEEVNEEKENKQTTEEPVMLTEDTGKTVNSEEKAGGEPTEQRKEETEEVVEAGPEPTESVNQTGEQIRETVPVKTALPEIEDVSKPEVSEKPVQTEEPMVMLCSLEDASYAMEWIPINDVRPVEKPVEESSVVATGPAIPVRPISTMVPNSQETETVTVYDTFFQAYREGDMKACVIDSQSRMQEFQQTYQKKTLNGAWKHIVSGMDNYDATFFQQNALVMVCALEPQEYVFTLDAVTAGRKQDGRSVLCFQLSNQLKESASSDSAFYMYHRAIIRVPKFLLHVYETGEIIVNDKKIDVEW